MAHFIQILKKGVWPSQFGPIDINDAVLENVLETFSPSRFAPPLKVSHEIPRGLTEAELPLVDDVERFAHLSEPTSQQTPIQLIDPSKFAYGSPVKLHKRGDGVWAEFASKGISNAFLEWVRNGNILSISPGLYRPTDAGNPVRGKWCLKHIAGLGGESPAQKGMEPLAAGLGLSDSAGGVCIFHKQIGLQEQLAAARRAYLLS